MMNRECNFLLSGTATFKKINWNGDIYNRSFQYMKLKIIS